MTPKWWPRVPKEGPKWRALDAQLVSMYRSGAHPNGTFDLWELIEFPYPFMCLHVFYHIVLDISNIFYFLR